MWRNELLLRFHWNAQQPIHTAQKENSSLEGPGLFGMLFLFLSSATGQTQLPIVELRRLDSRLPSIFDFIFIITQRHAAATTLSQPTMECQSCLFSLY